MESVLELTKYKVGDTAWWVALRYKKPLPELPEDFWMSWCHPKTCYEKGPYKKNWTLKSKLPRLHPDDFTGIVTILTSDIVVELFDICDVIRSTDTGEFFYSNQNDEWMPESYIFDTIIAARRESTRIAKMVLRWAESHDVGS